MADITYCSVLGCPLQKSCKRKAFSASSQNERRAYHAFQFSYATNSCAFYIRQLSLTTNQTEIQKGSEVFNKVLSEVTPETEQKVRKCLDGITACSQRAADMRMLIAAKIGDKCTDMIEVCQHLDIDIEGLTKWLSGRCDFTLFDIAKIERFLGEKILNL